MLQHVIVTRLIYNDRRPYSLEILHKILTEKKVILKYSTLAANRDKQGFKLSR